MYKYAVKLMEKKQCGFCYDFLYYIKTAADNGNDEAMLKYGEIILNNSVLNIGEAVKYFQKSAKLLNNNAMIYYGFMLFYGEGIKMNKTAGLFYIITGILLTIIYFFLFCKWT